MRPRRGRATSQYTQVSIEQLKAVRSQTHPAETTKNEQDKPPETPYSACMKSVTDVIENALALPLVDRSYLATKLIESLEMDDLSSEAVVEYDRRVSNWKTEKEASSSSEELDAKVQAILHS